MKNIKSIFFITTFIILLLSISIVSATDINEDVTKEVVQKYL